MTAGLAENATLVSFDGGVSVRASYCHPDRYRTVEDHRGHVHRVARGCERHRSYGFHRDWLTRKEGTLRPDYVLYHLKPLQPAIGPRRVRAIHEWMLAKRDSRLVYSRAEYYLFERVGDRRLISRAGPTVTVALGPRAASWSKVPIACPS